MDMIYMQDIFSTPPHSPSQMLNIYEGSLCYLVSVDILYPQDLSNTQSGANINSYDSEKLTKAVNAIL